MVSEPLLSWVWSSFVAASTWWSKALIAVGTLGGIAAFAPVVWWAAKEDQRRASDIVKGAMEMRTKPIMGSSLRISAAWIERPL